jgi:poly(beta-D-mannuronate) lyase
MYKAGTGAINQYIYKTRYYWSPSQNAWRPTEFSGANLVANTWYVGEAFLVGSDTPDVDPFFWVAYVCQWTGTQWKCGCKNSTCSTPMWQLQGWQATASGGGNNSGGDPVGSGSKIPAATRTVNVSNSSQLSSALSSAQAGDHIVLANGSYGGFSVSRSGQSGKPIVIRPTNLHGAKFTGNIAVSGNYVWVLGMDMGSRTISVTGSNNRISRNYFKATAGNAVVTQKGAVKNEIDHNEHAGGTLTYSSSGNHAIFMRSVCAHESNNYVHHNYLHDSSGPEVNAVALMSGWGVLCSGSHGPAPHANNLIEHNLIVNWGSGYCLRTKDGGNTFRLNTCINVPPGIQNRHGEQNQWIANWVEGGGPLRLYDGKNSVIGNRFTGTYLQIGSGNRAYLAPQESSTYVAATDSTVAGNIGQLRIGFNYSNYDTVPAKNNRIEAHQTGNGCGQGSITCARHTGTTFSSNTSRSFPEAVKLTPSQVGPNAPTAPTL